MDRIEETLEKVEALWLSPLYRNCKLLFSGVFLPSHDHLHHARVWSQARIILSLLYNSGTVIPESMAEQLIIAVFFHDTGLVRTHDEHHGKESRQLCEDYFQAWVSTLKRPDEEVFGAILQAIEYHDDKSLKSTFQKFLPGRMPDLLSLVSTSDDLDAFGSIGIYRYAEIYLLRGIAREQIPSRVCKNVQNRFNNLKNIFAGFQEFISLQESRFRVVYDFYSNESPGWEAVLLEIIRKSLVDKVNLLEPGRILPGTEFDAEISEFFRVLDLEAEVQET